MRALSDRVDIQLPFAIDRAPCNNDRQTAPLSARWNRTGLNESICYPGLSIVHPESLRSDCRESSAARLKAKHSKVVQKAESEIAFLAGQCSRVIRWQRSRRLPRLIHWAICVNMSSILLSPCSVHNLFIKMLHLLKGKGRGFLFNVGGQNRQRPPKEHGPTVWKAADRLPGIELNPVTSCLESAAPTTVHQHRHELFTALIRCKANVLGWLSEDGARKFSDVVTHSATRSTQDCQVIPDIGKNYPCSPPPPTSSPDLLWKVCCNQFH